MLLPGGEFALEKIRADKFRAEKILRDFLKPVRKNFAGFFPKNGPEKFRGFFLKKNSRED